MVAFSDRLNLVQQNGLPDTAQSGQYLGASWSALQQPLHCYFRFSDYDISAR